MNAEPVMPSWVWDVIVLCLILAPLVVVYVWALVEQWRTARRRRTQNLAQATDSLMKRGMRAAWRNGWIQDGDQ